MAQEAADRPPCAVLCCDERNCVYLSCLGGIREEQDTEADHIDQMLRSDGVRKKKCNESLPIANKCLN